VAPISTNVAGASMTPSVFDARPQVRCPVLQVLNEASQMPVGIHRECLHPNCQSGVVLSVDDRQYLLSALELLDPEINTWECIGNVIMDCLKSGMNSLRQASFLPEKLDHRLLLVFPDVTLRDVKAGSQTTKIDVEGDKEQSKLYGELIHEVQSLFDYIA
jgi:hypothetical protein